MAAGTLRELFANDVSVGDATIHLWGDLDREALLLARAKPTSANLREARRILDGVPSALAREAFLARPLSRGGKHDEALSVRLEALRFTPRWDPFQSGVVLSGLAASLSAVGRADDALAVAAEAFRHAPLDPYALRAWATAARQTGRTTEAAAVSAWLRDMGYGKPIVSDPPSDEERATDASPLPVDDLAPLTDEDMARFLVLAEVDEGFDSKRYKIVRHAMALMRRGEQGLARNNADGDDGDSGLATALAGWMNLAPPNEIAWLQKESIRRTLDATPEGEKARVGTRSKKPNRYWSHAHFSHLGYRNQLASEKEPLVLEALLFSAARLAFVEGLSKLSGHPLAERVKALRAELFRPFPPGEYNQTNRGARDTIGADGKSVSFPIRDDEDRSEFPPCIEWSENALSRCGACKARIEKDACVLRVGRMSLTDGEVKWKRYHLACAADNASAQKPLRRALERERRSAPELTAAMAHLPASTR